MRIGRLQSGTVAFVGINFLTKDERCRCFAAGIDWRLGQAGLLILFALWILAGLALLCSTRLEMISTLAILFCLFPPGVDV